MAYEQTQKYIELEPATTALSTYQYRMVKAGTTAGTFISGSTRVAGTITVSIGVLQGAPTVAGEACQIATFNGGIGKLVCASTKLTPGTNYIMGALGKARSTASAVAKDVIYGPWLSANPSTDGIGTAMYQIIGIST